MTDAGLHMMAFHIRPQAGAQILSGECLTDGTDIVPLALHGEQCRVSDRPWVDTATAPYEFTQRQCVLLKHGADGLKVELGRQVHHRQVLVVELAYRGCLLFLAIGEMVEKIDLRFDVPIQIYAHESGKLHKARIDAAQGARIPQRDDPDEIL